MVFVDLDLRKTCLNLHANQYLDKSLKTYSSICITKTSELFIGQCMLDKHRIQDIFNFLGRFFKCYGSNFTEVNT